MHQVKCAGKYLAHLLEDRMVPETLLASVPSLAGPAGPAIVEEVENLTRLPLRRGAVLKATPLVYSVGCRV